jgi:hypothetical protein
MANRPHVQHRLRLLVHQATPSGSPTSINSGTLQSGINTPSSSPLKSAANAQQQQQQQQKQQQQEDGSTGSGGSNPNWWMLVS